MGTCHRPWKDATKIWNVLELMCRAKRGPAASAGGEMCHLDAGRDWMETIESDSGLSHHWMVYGWWLGIFHNGWFMDNGLSLSHHWQVSYIWWFMDGLWMVYGWFITKIRKSKWMMTFWVPPWLRKPPYRKPEKVGPAFAFWQQRGDTSEQRRDVESTPNRKDFNQGCSLLDIARFCLNTWWSLNVFFSNLLLPFTSCKKTWFFLITYKSSFLLNSNKGLYQLVNSPNGFVWRYSQDQIWSLSL